MLQIFEIKNPFERRVYARNVECTGKPLSSYLPADGQFDVFINAHQVKSIEQTLPRDGDQIVYCPHVGGGGFKRILGFVAMIALAAYAGSVVGGLWESQLGAAFAGGAWGATLASGAIMFLGGKLINSIFPMDRAAANSFSFKDHDTSQSYGWNLPTISNRQGGIIGETYGEAIPQAQLLMQHVETVNDKQYLNLLYCGGYGPIDAIDHIRIDTTDIESFTGVELQTRFGTNDQEKITLINDTPLDQSVGLTLDTSTPVTRTTDATTARALEVTLEWPNGLYHVKDDGNLDNATVSLQIEYRLHGTDKWYGTQAVCSYDSNYFDNVATYNVGGVYETWTITPVYETRRNRKHTRYYMQYLTVRGSVTGQYANAAPGAIYDNGHIRFRYKGGTYAAYSSRRLGAMYITETKSQTSITAATNETLRRTFKFDGLASGQYDVKITLTNRPTGSRYSSYTQWSILTSYLARTFNRPNKVLVGLRILATNQLSGGVPNINWRQRRLHVWVWNPSTGAYEQRDATNPIWAAYDILHGARQLKNINTGAYEFVVNGAPKDRFIDYFDEWESAAAYADEMVLSPEGTQEKRFTFNFYFDTEAQRINAAQKAATVGHAAIIQHGRNYGVSVDRPGTIGQIFGEGRTEVSSVKGTFTSREERARAVEVTYSDADNDYKNTMFTVRSPSYNTSREQDNTAQLTLYGVSRRSQAYREAIHALATNERQLQYVELSADMDAIVAQYGDIVGYNHAVSHIGIASGRIVDATETTVKLDKDVAFEEDISYEVYVQLSDDTLVRRDVSSYDAETRTLTVTEPFATVPQKYDNYAFGEVGKAVKPFRIVGATRDGDFKVNLKLAEYDAAIYTDSPDYAKYPVIDYTSHSTNITELAAEEYSYPVNDGTIMSDIRVNWSYLRGDAPDRFQVSYSMDGYSYELAGTTIDTHFTITGVKSGETYYVRVSSVFQGVVAYSKTVSVYITGKDTPPEDVLRFDVTQSGETMIAIITEVSDRDISYYEVRQGSTWEKSVLIGTFQGNRYEFPATQEGTITYFCKACDTSGNYSAKPAICIVNVSGLPERNIMIEKYLYARDGERTSEWSNDNLNYRIKERLTLGDYDLFSDIFGSKHELMDDAEIIFEPIDLGRNMIDEDAYWYDHNGTPHIKTNKTLGDYDLFSDIFGTMHEYVAVKFQNITYSNVMLDYAYDGNAKYSIEHRTSLDGVSWSGWIPSNVSQFAGRFIQYRVLPRSVDGIGNIVIRGLKVVIDVPDIEDIIEDVTLSATEPTTIVFNKKFQEIKSFASYTEDFNGKQITCVMTNQTLKSIDVSVLDSDGNQTAGHLQKIVIRGY